MLEGKLTEADEEHYAKWGVEGLDSDVFQNRKGLLPCRSAWRLRGARRA